MRILALIAVLGLILFGLWRCVADWTPSRSDFPVQGISLAPGTESANWDLVKSAGVDFAYIVATESSDIRHEGFIEAVAGAKAAGIDSGAIHLFSLCRLASDQAENFIRTVPRDETDLPTVVELSLNPECADKPGREVLLTEVGAFLNMVEAHMGKPVMLKFGAAFERQYRISEAIDRPIWLERTFLRPDYASRGWALWQSASSHSVAGLAAPVQWSVAKPKQQGSH